jgi:hypothetical protein
MVRHPDQRTSWAALGVLRFSEPFAHGAEAVRSTMAARLVELQRTLPLAGARLRDGQWVAGEPNPVVVIPARDEPVPPSAVRHFDLAREAPLRIVAADDGTWATAVGHHAAFDGTNAFTMFRGVAGVEPHPAVIRSRQFQRRAAFPWDAAARLLRPADPVVPSSPRPPHESFLAAELPIVGKGIATRFPEACAAAAIAHNARAGKPCRRIGITLGLVAQTGEGDLSTYRRIDCPAEAPLRGAIEEALAATDEPWEIVHSPRVLRLLSPLVERMSDTVLVSNFGRVDIAGLDALEMYPVARGRSAVAFGAVRLARGASTLTLRARDLSRDDARLILDDVLERLRRR